MACDLKAHDFTIENLLAVYGRGEKELRDLAQAACLSAVHQSEERFDAPKCHPETRKAVINNIMSWVDSTDSNEPMMWMFGSAGVGKSAIAQTVCERCHQEGKLLASFFFSRTAGTGRDDGTRLVPTIAIQLAVVVPESRDFIVNALENNPEILSHPMEVQLQTLVLEPLIKVSTAMSSNSEVRTFHPYPYLVVIDALDECSDEQMQARIIICASFSSIIARAPIRFLFVCRPESQIRAAFNSSTVCNRCARVSLDLNRNDVDNDIRVYLRNEFALLKRDHPLRQHLLHGPDWPTSEDIQLLVSKASGQFIYASTILRYLRSSRSRDPRNTLISMISDTNTTLDPYTALDSLYRHVLRYAVTDFQISNDSIINVFQVLLFAFENRRTYNLRHPSNLAPFLTMDPDELGRLLSGLHSLLIIPESVDSVTHHGQREKSLLDRRPHPYYVVPSVPLVCESRTHSQVGAPHIEFCHTSFRDFLKTETRSIEHFIDETKAHIAIAHHCHARLSEYKPPKEVVEPALQYSRDHYFSHIRRSGYNGELLRELEFSETTMRNIMVLLIQLNDSSDDDVIHVNEQLECMFKFNFETHNSCFALPANHEVQNISSALNRIVDEIILSAYPSIDFAERHIVISIIENIARRSPVFNYFETRTTSIFLCWLAMLLEIPQRGKHLYLDSKKSLHLYTKICSDAEFREACVGNWNSEVLQYLLEKIEPSAVLDTDQFLAMSRNVIDNATTALPKYQFSKKKTADKFNETLRNNKLSAEKCLEGFIQKCLDLRIKEKSGDAIIYMLSSRRKEGTNITVEPSSSSPPRRHHSKATVGRWFGGTMNTSAMKKVKAMCGIKK